MDSCSRICAKINLSAVEENFRIMREKMKKDTRIIAVVKTDAYGHGAVPIAKLTENYDYLWGFATATVEEALELRGHGITKPILVLGFVFPEHYDAIAEYDLRPAVFKYAMAQQLSESALRKKKEISVHIALDTGMSRIGFADSEQALREIQEIAKLPCLNIEGMFTHFARADERDKTSAAGQLHRYLVFAEQLEKRGISIPLKHCSNSAGILEMPEANLDAVRAGITIYGIYPSDQMLREGPKLHPVMELKSHIAYIKNVGAGVPVSYGGTFVTPSPMRIATIPVGYGDGYPRSLSSRGFVLIRGRYAKILGRVCMDQFMVDVTDIPAEEFDEVTLLGRDGAEEISVDTLGEWSGRFPYEFVCDIGKRVPRVYIGNAPKD